jgi:hypothetical protein
MITDHIAIGSAVTKYDDFDIIVNLNYPENKAKLYEVTVEVQQGKLVIRAGLEDISPLYSSADSIGYTEAQRWDHTKCVFAQIVYLIVCYTNPGSLHGYSVSIPDPDPVWVSPPTPQILFHCFAGISRSSTAAMFYMQYTEKLPMKVIYHRVKNKRSYVHPNSGFVKLLQM